jgi:hypothetical protein
MAATASSSMCWQPKQNQPERTQPEPTAYLPMQKRLKITPSRSSDENSPVMLES